MKKRYKILLFVSAIVSLLALVPWKNMVEKGLQGVLRAEGFSGARLTVSELGLDRLVMQDVTIGNNNQLTLKSLTALYALRDIWHGKIREVKIHDLSLNPPLAEGQTKIVIGQGGLSMTRNSQNDNWEGPWQLQDIHIESGYADLPVIEGAGTLKAEKEKIALEGRFKSSDDTYHAEFKLDYPSTLTLVSVSLPWKGGRLKTEDVTLPLTRGMQPVKLVLQVQQVSVDELMQALTGKRVSATGAVSGALPLIVGPDGTVSFGEGQLNATGPGVISMPEDAIPGDNEQIVMTRAILKNFHYGSLSISMGAAKGDEISVLVALEGNNPDMYNGRPVKLNVRLGGDVLSFIRQNVMFLTDPKTMLKQGQP